jgi:hypothetical protein
MPKVTRKDWTPEDLIDGFSVKGETVGIPYEEIKHVTEKAALLIISGEEHWIPKSMIEDADESVIYVSVWFAEKEGILDETEDTYVDKDYLQ